MAQGDTFDVKDGDEVEISFQLNFKQAEVKKRRDADELSHVRFGFFQELDPSPALGGIVHVTALDKDPPGDAPVIPITQDDQKFTRLFKIGPIEMHQKTLPPKQLTLTVALDFVTADGTPTKSGLPKRAPSVSSESVPDEASTWFSPGLAETENPPTLDSRAGRSRPSPMIAE